MFSLILGLEKPVSLLLYFYEIPCVVIVCFFHFCIFCVFLKYYFLYNEDFLVLLFIVSSFLHDVIWDFFLNNSLLSEISNGDFNLLFKLIVVQPISTVNSLTLILWDNI